MTSWIIAGVIIVIIALVVARMSRSPAVPAWHDARRSEELRAVLAARQLDAQPAPKPPVPLPDFTLPLGWSWRTPAGAQAAANGAQWLIYDTEHRGRSVAGCNTARDSTGENIICRHTVVALKSDRLSLPACRLVPNLRRLGEQAAPQWLADKGLADSRIASLAVKSALTMARMDERGVALGFPGEPAFVDAFRVTCDDEPSVRALFDAGAIAILRRHPWAIVEGCGEWLAVSRNVVGALHPRSGDTGGWLSPESVAEVADLASSLAGQWQRQATLVNG